MKLKIALLLILFSAFRSVNGYAQTQEITQLILNYEKLEQLEAILDNMYKGYKILSKGYNTIKDISEGNFDLHKVFLDGLCKVSPSVRDYKRVVDIIAYQKMLVKEYKRAYNLFRNDPNLTLAELRYIESVYEYLFNRSLANLDQLLMIITAAQVRMDDKERLTAIDQIYFDMDDKLTFLHHFNSTTKLLTDQRAKESGEIDMMKKLYNIN